MTESRFLFSTDAPRAIVVVVIYIAPSERLYISIVSLARGRRCRISRDRAVCLYRSLPTKVIKKSRIREKRRSVQLSARHSCVQKSSVGLFVAWQEWETIARVRARRIKKFERADDRRDSKTSRFFPLEQFSSHLPSLLAGVRVVARRRIRGHHRTLVVLLLLILFGGSSSSSSGASRRFPSGRLAIRIRGVGHFPEHRGGVMFRRHDTPTNAHTSSRANTSRLSLSLRKEPPSLRKKRSSSSTPLSLRLKSGGGGGGLLFFEGAQVKVPSREVSNGDKEKTKKGRTQQEKKEGDV